MRRTAHKAAALVVATLSLVSVASASAAPSELVEFNYSVEGTFPPGAVFAAAYYAGVVQSSGGGAFSSHGAIGGANVLAEEVAAYSSPFYSGPVSAYIHQLCS